MVSVTPDGGCMARAAGVSLFKDDSHWMLLAKAINKFIRENWSLIGGLLNFPMRLKFGGSAKEIVCQNEEEYLQYLKRNEAIYYWDFVALCELLHVRITVVKTRGDYIENVQKIDPISGININEEDDRIVLLLNSDHFYAIAPPAESIYKDQELLQKLAKYVYPVNNSPTPTPVNNPEEATSSASASDYVQRKFEAMEREIRLLSLRVSEQGVEMRRLKEKQDNLGKVCSEHLNEIEELKRSNEKLTKSIEQSRIFENSNDELTEDIDDEDDEEALEQCKTLYAMKNQGSSRVHPQAQPVQKNPKKKCDECKFEFITEGVLDKHKAQFHKMKDPEKENENISLSAIPVMISNQKPSGIVKRQYNCHECDYQGHRSKALYKHSVETKHNKIDSLAETCYTCRQTFDNFMVLMKHRKEAHYDTISECHGFKAGDCKFGSRCYYRHSEVSGETFQSKNNGSNNEKGSNDSFQEEVKLPPDLNELTEGIKKLMSQFLLNREKTEKRQRGF